MIGVGPQQKLHFTTSSSRSPRRCGIVVENARRLSAGQSDPGMIERRMSPKNLSSPIGIAQMSGAAAREGAAEFLGFMP